MPHDDIIILYAHITNNLLGKKAKKLKIEPQIGMIINGMLPPSISV